MQTKNSTRLNKPRTIFMCIWARKCNLLVHLWVDGQETLVMLDHPYYMVGRDWVKAGELVVGERLRTLDGGTVAIGEVWTETLPETYVYKFQVVDFHSYYAGSVCVLVHNVAGYVPKGAEMLLAILLMI